MINSEPILDKEEEIILSWASNPMLFAEEALRFSARGIEFSTQQKEGVEELRKLVTGKIKVNELERGIPHKITKEDKYYASKRGISIMSGQGAGKDFFAAFAILWMLTCFPQSKVPCTAPKRQQLREILWGEIIKLGRGSEDTDKIPPEQIPVTKNWYNWLKDAIVMKGHPEWYASANTANIKASKEEQAGALAGQHSPYMMLLVEEAAEVPDPVFEVFEGTMTDICNFGMIIFNPLYRRGYAYKTHYGSNKDQWIRLRWNCEESERVTASHIQKQKDKYGIESNVYRIRVLGLPPTADSDGLIPIEWVQEAVNRDIIPDENEPLLLGVDVGAGGNKSVICPRHGGKILPLMTNHSRDTMIVAEWVCETMDELEAKEAFIDNIGIGLGVYNRVRQLKYKALAADVRRRLEQADKNKRQYCTTRDKMWWKVREQFEQGIISIPNDEELINQLSVIRFEERNDGIHVEGKREWKSRGIESPDRADALMYSYFKDSKFYYRSQQDEYEKEEDRENQYHNTTWMSA